MKFSEAVSGKLEYLYVHLFDEEYELGIADDTYTWDQDFDLHIVRAGINFSFFGP